MFATTPKMWSTTLVGRRARPCRAGLRSRAKEWGIDPKRVGILGFSAGGHLAATAATNYAKRSYDPIDETDTILCRPDFVLCIPIFIYIW